MNTKINLSVGVVTLATESDRAQLKARRRRESTGSAIPKFNTVLLALGALGWIAASNALAEPRPISDFLEVQGTMIPDFYVPWTDPVRGLLLFVDYAGVDNAFWHLNLPTTYSGSIDERLLADGTAEVHVILHTHNAIMYTSPVYPAPTTPCGCSLIGNTPPDVLAGAPSALGDCSLELQFTNPGGLGAPLPDFFQLVVAPLPGQNLLRIGFVAQGTGPLPDGTTGSVQTRETGLIATSQIANPGSRVAFDGFPAEHIIIKPIGN